MLATTERPTADDLALAIADLRCSLARHGWAMQRIDQAVLDTYGEQLREFGLDEVGTPPLFEVTA